MTALLRIDQNQPEIQKFCARNHPKITDPDTIPSKMS